MKPPARNDSFRAFPVTEAEDCEQTRPTVGADDLVKARHGFHALRHVLRQQPMQCILQAMAGSNRMSRGIAVFQGTNAYAHPRARNETAALSEAVQGRPFRFV